mgnify:CR=1 FL=1
MPRKAKSEKPLINAKAETLTALPTFQPHLSQRCLLPADGFFEGGAYFHQPGNTPFCFAGLWRQEAVASLYERRHEMGGQTAALQTGGHRPPLQSAYTLLTTTPNDSVAKFHDRMPFIVRAEDYRDWLAGDWLRVLQAPDKSPLEKFQKQPELF